MLFDLQAVLINHLTKSRQPFITIFDRWSLTI